MKIVTIGCGTGHSAILRGLAEKGIKPTAIVAVTDNGGHSGELRKQLGLPAVGDLRQCISAIMKNSALKTSFDFRFSSGELTGTSVGNIILAAAALNYGSLTAAAIKLCKSLKCNGIAMPATDESIHIGAETISGKKIIGEHNIINRQPKEEIKSFFLSPDAATTTAVTKAIKKANAIVIAPGVMMSLAGVLLTKEISDAIKKSDALKIVVCNIMSHPNQPEIVNTSQHVNWLRQYIDLDLAIVNNGTVDTDVLGFYNKLGAQQTKIEGQNNIEIVTEDMIEKTGLQAALAKERAYDEKIQRTPHLIRHDGSRVADIILRELAKRK